MSTIWIKYSDWLKIGNGHGVLIYSAGQGLILDFCTECRVVLSKDDRRMSRVMGKEQKAEWRSQHKKTTNRKQCARPQMLLVRIRTHLRTMKKGTKIVNHNWVNNHACSFPQNIHAATYIHVVRDNLLKLYQKISLPTILLNLQIKMEANKT